MLTTMEFYVKRNSDGLLHVTNAVGGFIGQHHVHDDAGFEEWRAAKGSRDRIPDEHIHWYDTVTNCDCGLTNGEQKSGL